ncbi:putative plant self-incompatibility S1 [Helianthus annuus]|nr:putative plant self-incompatibility S1 [Helianthus annuus]
MSFLLKLSFCIFLWFHLSNILKANTPPSSKSFEPFRITITNKDVPNVAVGCDDRGSEVLKPGDFTSWKFRMNFLGTNSYGCRFYWFEGGNVRKFNDFPVFDKDIYNFFPHGFSMNRYYWYVAQDGFYFSIGDAAFPAGYWKMYGWNDI